MSVNTQQQCPTCYLQADDPKIIDPWSRFNSNKKQFIRPRDLPHITGLSRTTIWRLERSGDFPNRIRLSAGAVGYRMSDIQAWLDSRKTVGGLHDN